MEKDEIAYNTVMDALNYKIAVLVDSLNSYLPQELRDEKKKKLAYLVKLQDALI